MGRVSNVNKNNYGTLAKAIIHQRGGEGAMIAREKTLYTKHSYTVERGLRQWGAWRSYLLGIKHLKAVHHMDREGCIMVPAEWPHEFTSDVDDSRDLIAGIAYEQWYFAKGPALDGKEIVRKP